MRRKTNATVANAQATGGSEGLSSKAGGSKCNLKEYANDMPTIHKAKD